MGKTGFGLIWCENRCWFILVPMSQGKLNITLPSDEEAVTLSTFTYHVFWSWCGLMTGGIIGVILAIYAFIGTSVAVMFGVFGAIAIFVACYHLWREERTDKLSVIENNTASENALTNELKMLRTTLSPQIEENNRLRRINENLTRALETSIEAEKRPRLIGFFQELSYFQMPAEKRSKEKGVAVSIIEGTRFVLRVGFVNENSTPTTIQNFRLTIKTDKKNYSAICVEDINYFNNTDYLVISGNNFIMFGMTPQNWEDYMSPILGSKKCEKGEQLNGTLAFDYEADFKDLTIQEYQLDIEDAWGVLHPIVDWKFSSRPSKRLFNF